MQVSDAQRFNAGGFYLTFRKARGNVKNSAESCSRTLYKIAGAILRFV
jgi:hypothetical protein